MPVPPRRVHSIGNETGERGMFNLSDKVAVVTGAASGIGEAIAHALAGAGAKVFITDVNRTLGEAVAGAINASGKGGAEYVEVDVADEASTRRCAERVLSVHGQCDVVVNNAGIGHVGTVLTTNDEDLDRLYRVN